LFHPFYLLDLFQRTATAPCVLVRPIGSICFSRCYRLDSHLRDCLLLHTAGDQRTSDLCCDFQVNVTRQWTDCVTLTFTTNHPYNQCPTAVKSKRSKLNLSWSPNQTADCWTQNDMMDDFTASRWSFWITWINPKQSAHRHQFSCLESPFAPPKSSNCCQSRLPVAFESISRLARIEWEACSCSSLQSFVISRTSQVQFDISKSEDHSTLNYEWKCETEKMLHFDTDWKDFLFLHSEILLTSEHSFASNACVVCISSSKFV
jgi:hypothetical protein